MSGAEREGGRGRDRGGNATDAKNTVSDGSEGSHFSASLSQCHTESVTVSVVRPT